MEHFKKFLIRLQTFNIRIITRKKNADAPPYNPREVQLYDLSHENPVVTPAFKNEIKELTELAITDLLNIPGEQAKLQLRRLESTKDLFRRFWKNYYNAPDPTNDHDRRTFFFTLDLDDIFIVQGMEKMSHTIAVTQQFLDDLYDSILYREEYLNAFEKAVLQILLSPEGQAVDVLLPEPVPEIPIIKDHVVPDLFEILKDYFMQSQQKPLLKLLQSGQSNVPPLIFNGKGNQLADAFKQLYEANLIVGCNKAGLESWILQHFRYQDKGRVKNFTPKYLNAIISSDIKSCQSPILDTKKSPDGRFMVLPVQRIKRNNKKY